jgi:hypothetical protein
MDAELRLDIDHNVDTVRHNLALMVLAREDDAALGSVIHREIYGAYRYISQGELALPSKRLKPGGSRAHFAELIASNSALAQ